MFMFPLLLPLFTPCYYGASLQHASAQLSTALLHSNWSEMDKSMQKDLEIFMENLKVPLKVNFFRVIDLNLETFRVICKSAYSLYAVIKPLKN